jgi:hypothetical protein
MRCKACLTEKALSDFYTSNQASCKECVKQRTRENRLQKIDHYRQYDRMRASQPHRRANSYMQVKAWREANPTWRKVHAKVASALRNGLLKKQPCWVCGQKAVAHHPDYDRPLDVVWLCQPHHKQAHALVGNEAAFKDAA